MRFLTCVVLFIWICVECSHKNMSLITDLERKTTIGYAIKMFRKNHISSMNITDQQSDIKQCKTYRSGIYYNGTKSHPYTGQQCLPWSTFHTNQTAVTPGDNNYCRNPDRDPLGPWCYIENIKKQYCGIPVCGATDELNQLYMEYPENSIIKTHLYDISIIITQSIFPVILVVGTVLNSCSIALFTRPSLCKSTTSLLVVILAFTDTFSLYLALFLTWLRSVIGWHIEYTTTLSCIVVVYMNHVFASMSNWLLVLVTLERAIAVTKPHQAKIVCTMKKARNSVFSIFFCICLVNLTVIFGERALFTFVFDSNEISFDFLFRCEYCCVLDIVLVRFAVYLVDALIPFFIILIGNIIIIVNLTRANKKREKMTCSEKTELNIKHLHSLTKTLVIVSFSYLVLYFPHGIFALLWSYIRHMYNSYDEFICGRRLLYICVISFLSINYSINFILYCIGGRRFRNKFLLMIGCKKLVLTNSKYDSKPCTTVGQHSQDTGMKLESKPGISISRSTS